MKKCFSLVVMLLILYSCTEKKDTKTHAVVISADDFHTAQDQITDIMVHDIFSPPVASRIYAYSNLAAYEIVAKHEDRFVSIAEQIKAELDIPPIDTTDIINYKMAALIAQLEIAKTLIFSEAKINTFRDSLSGVWLKADERVFRNSESYALRVAEIFKTWIDRDNYKETRTMPKFSVYSDDPSRWQPTPPAYMDGIEPHWMKIRPFTLDSASQFKPEKHPEFSMEKNSRFYNELMEVYLVREEMGKSGNKSEEMSIAKFWDCNPYVSTQRGHLMFATKKITPGGHWMGITKLACMTSGADFNESVYAYTVTAITMADAFISCWDEKYRSNLIRPETLIHKYIDDQWQPVLQTPPFPEYTSGHSVVSAACAEVLTRLFGEPFAFDDTTEMAYGLPERSFPSFKDAAKEAAISRLYGGIHYRSAIENGLKQGESIGKNVLHTLEVKALGL